jgi:hypothetical protein
LKVLTAISGLFRKDIGDDLFDALASIYPDGVTGSQDHAFHCMLPSESGTVKQLVDRLNEAGLKPHTRGKRRVKGGEYIFVLHRRYEYADLVQLQFVECMPLDCLSHPKTDQSDRIVAHRREFKARDRIKRYFAVEHRLLVRDDVKTVLESAALAHVHFRLVILKPAREKRRDWWELTSDFVMPRLSPSLEITSGGKRVERGHSAYAWGFSEGVYAYPELRYLRKDVEALQPFDLAVTHEGQSGSKRHVMSQRFYETCISNGIDTNWLPVHVEDG